MVTCDGQQIMYITLLLLLFVRSDIFGWLRRKGAYFKVAIKINQPDTGEW